MALHQCWRVSVAVIFLERLFLPGLYRLWCGVHQFDLAVHDVISSCLQVSFQLPLHSLIGYLRHQTVLKADMETVCHTVAMTPALSLGEVLEWFITHRIRMRQYLEEKETDTSPPETWWVLLYLIRAILKPFNICLRRVQ